MEKISEKSYQGQKEGPLERRIERLRPIFEKSLDVFCNPEIDHWEGAITVSHRRPDGTVELVSGLVCVKIDEDGPELAWIDDEGKPIALATMEWEEIIDAKI